MKVSELIDLMPKLDPNARVVTPGAWDWELFADMAYQNGKWPSNVSNRPVDISEIFDSKDPEIFVELQGGPHHALLDARVLAKICAT